MIALLRGLLKQVPRGTKSLYPISVRGRHLNWRGNVIDSN